MQTTPSMTTTAKTKAKHVARSIGHRNPDEAAAWSAFRTAIFDRASRSSTSSQNKKHQYP
jgi:hypothetical protein